MKWLAGLFGLLAALLPATAIAGIIDPSRSIDWTQVGVLGGIPNRTTICATLNPGATATQITEAISACPSEQVVFLSAGTYNLSGGIVFNNKSNVTLRGAGPNQTFLIFTAGDPCGGSAAVWKPGSLQSMALSRFTAASTFFRSCSVRFGNGHFTAVDMATPRQPS